MLAKKETDRRKGVILSAIAGGTAGLFTDLMYFPIDSLKTRIQASIKGQNFVKEARKVGFLKGISASLVISFPAAMSFFAVYDGGKVLLSDVISNQASVSLLSAAAAEIAQNLVRNPLEVCKQRMQIGLHNTIWETLRSVHANKGYYNGFLSAIFRDIPFGAIQFPIYECLKKAALKYFSHGKNGETSLPFWVTPINGCIAASIAAFATTPLDVIKTRLMTQKTEYYKGIFDCATKICREEGFRRLFAAWHFRVFSISTGGILFFTAYEESRKLLSSALLRY